MVNSKTSAKIEGLRPYTEYSIYIRGYAHESGAGPKSEIVTVRTDPDSEYNVTSQVKISYDKLYNTDKVKTHLNIENKLQVKSV